mmetsp:Transcript_7999/g.13425  ORF Transcript_7999/g.13425 Transcript_7999/m.13425 type:complete len:124 (+) Transcript_7999:1660-2031(+)
MEFLDTVGQSFSRAERARMSSHQLCLRPSLSEQEQGRLSPEGLRKKSCASPQPHGVLPGEQSKVFRMAIRSSGLPLSSKSRRPNRSCERPSIVPPESGTSLVQPRQLFKNKMAQGMVDKKESC